jgi:hypothetical protein
MLVLSSRAAAQEPSRPEVASLLPDPGLAQSTEYRKAAYPDWTGKALRSATLAERKRSEGGVLGLLTLTASDECWVSVLYYAATGRGMELLDGLPLPPGQHTTLSFPLPPGDAGLTRLLVWRTRPDAAMLEELGASALDPERILPGLVDERWFRRVQPGVSLPVYDERQPHAPSDFFRARYPVYSATLGSNGVVTTRNCSVLFRGPTRFASDQWGSFGQWQLGAGTVLEIKLVLPSRRDYSRALLRLQGQLDGPFVPSEAVRVRLEVNGWRSDEVLLGAGIGVQEQVSFDLSQSIEYGLNTLSLRSDSFGTDWLLRSIELWLE